MVQLIGRITKDAIVTDLKDGKKVLNFSIAITDYYKTKDGQSVKLVTYVNCSYWNKPDNVAGILKKGKTVEVNGRMKVSAYLNGEGLPVGTLNFHVNNFKAYGNTIMPAIEHTNTAVVNTGEDIPATKTEDDLPF